MLYRLVNSDFLLKNFLTVVFSLSLNPPMPTSVTSTHSCNPTADQRAAVPMEKLLQAD